MTIFIRKTDRAIVLPVDSVLHRVTIHSMTLCGFSIAGHTAGDSTTSTTCPTCMPHPSRGVA